MEDHLKGSAGSNNNEGSVIDTNTDTKIKKTPSTPSTRTTPSKPIKNLNQLM